MKIPLWLCILTIFILLGLLTCVLTHTCNNKLSVSRFLNIEAKNAYQLLLDELGHPQIVVNQPGGFVMWFPKQIKSSPYNSIILKDEQILHNTPQPHYDFLYTTIAINIPEKELMTVLSVNKSLFYDRVTRELTVRCNSLLANECILNDVVNKLLPNSTGSFTDKLNIINIQNEQQSKEKFVTKTYKKIPVSP